jgi:hypothetical protein
MLEVPLRRGGAARIVSADSERVTLEAPFASPPGSTLELVVADATLGVKVQRCRRLEAEGASSFRIDGRWISLSRVQRDALGIPAQKPDAS